MRAPGRSEWIPARRACYSWSVAGWTLRASGSRARPVRRRMNNADYIRDLRPLLPAEAFRPNPWAYVPIGIHVAIMVTGWFATQWGPHILWPVEGLVIGNSAAAICLYAHEVSHRSVTTN